MIQIENLSQEIQSKEKEIERLSVEKEEFSGLLIRDLLAAQKLAEELRKENEFLRKQLAEADAKNPETPPRYPFRVSVQFLFSSFSSLCAFVSFLF